MYEDEQGKYICGIAHGFFLQLTDVNNEEYHEAGIRCDVDLATLMEMVKQNSGWSDTQESSPVSYIRKTKTKKKRPLLI